MPSGAFKAVAGTDVVTDLLIFRRRPDGDTPQPLAGWERAVDFVTDDGTIAVNRYFADHPEHILGTPGLGRGAHHRAELVIRPLPGQDLGELLADRLSAIVVRAHTAGLSFIPPAGPLPPARVAPATGWASDARPGTIRAAPGGSGFQRLDPGTRAWTPYPVRTRAGAGTAAQTGREMRRLLGTAGRRGTPHRRAGSGGRPDTRHASRAVVNRLYDAYVTEFGPINRFTEQARTGWVLVRNLDPDEIDPDWPTRQRSVNGAGQVDAAGDPVLQVHRVVTDQVRPPAVDALRLDPGFATVMALELFDEDTRTATKAPALLEDVLRVRARPTVAANPAEALALAMDADNGAIDLHHVAALLPAGTTPGQARDLLQGLVFPDPDNHGVLVPASRYLSGDVRGKLDTARTAAASDDAYTANVTALAAVVPVDLGPGDIEIKPGVTWITPKDYTLFLREVLEAPTATAAWSDLVGRWDIHVPPFEKFSHPIQHTYGTGQQGRRRPAGIVAEQPADQHHQDGRRLRRHRTAGPRPGGHRGRPGQTHPPGRGVRLLGVA